MKRSILLISRQSNCESFKLQLNVIFLSRILQIKQINKWENLQNLLNLRDIKSALSAFKMLKGFLRLQNFLLLFGTEKQPLSEKKFSQNIIRTNFEV